MNKIAFGLSRPILGLFERDHMLYETDRKITETNDEPSLTEMTTFAIEHFLKFNQGFFLLVEGGRIDHGHHETRARYALDEFVQFDDTIGQTKQLLKDKGVLDETLLVVTADHSHVFSFGAYGSRGANILGFAALEQLNVSDIDKLPITIISYGNGPNYQEPRNASYLAALDTNSTKYLFPTALPMRAETHGGEDVPVYAQGPWSHLFIGTMEQHTIAHKMAYAACWGDYINRDGCKSTVTTSTPLKSNGIKSICGFIFPQIFILIFFLSIV
jgi:alkaline phosphatase